jgi:hypothetical protein
LSHIPCKNKIADFCPDVPADKAVNVTWRYAVEFRPAVSAEAMNSIINILELQLVSELLTCNDVARRHTVRRKLLLDGIAGLDYMPVDTQRMDEVCFSNETINGVCNTYMGRMLLYLEQTVNGKDAINDIRSNIQRIMKRKDFLLLPEIIRMWYVGPEISVVSEINRGNEPSDVPKQSGSTLSTGGVVAFGTLGFFVLSALMLAMFRGRGRNSHNVDDASGSMERESTFMTTVTGVEATPAPSPQKISPFTAMLPQAYNLHDPETMSAILEGDSDSDSRASSGSVIVSDGGFTTDGEESTVDGSASTTKLEPVLGHHKVEDETPNERALLFEDDNEISSIDKNMT